MRVENFEEASQKLKENKISIEEIRNNNNILKEEID